MALRWVATASTDTRTSENAIKLELWINLIDTWGYNIDFSREETDSRLPQLPDPKLIERHKSLFPPTIRSV